MGQLSQNTHPLVRDGRSQEDRRLAALDPSYIDVDGRSLEQILEFVYEYARQVNYYDTALNKKDWLDFFRNSVPFQIARIIRMDLEELRTEYSAVSILLQREPDFPAFNPMLDYLFDLVGQINFWRDKLEKDTSGLKAFLDNLISSNLSSALGRLVACANAANSWGYRSKYNFFSFKQDAWRLEFRDFLAVDEKFAAPAIDLGEALENAGQSTISLLSAHAVIGREQGLALGKRKLDELFETFLEALEKTQDEAKDRLRASIVNDEAHEPHLGLFFAFLEIFNLARNDLNRMTKRHLDFYYKKVLQLKERGAVLDKVHLVFELSPLEEKYALKKGMRFTAGEDDAEVDMHFELEEGIVVDSAQIESLQTLYLDQIPAEASSEDIPDEAAYQVKGIYMAPQANTVDGQGEAFPDPDTSSWKTVGDKVSKLVDEEKTTDKDNPQFKPHPYAELGIILGAQALYLQEGSRTITLKLACSRSALNSVLDDFTQLEEAVRTQYALTDQAVASLKENGYDWNLLPGRLNKWSNGLAEFNKQAIIPHAQRLPHSERLSEPQRELLVKYAERRNIFDVYLTIEDGWLPVKETDISIETVDANRFNLVIEMELDENQPPLAIFDPEVHGLELGIDVPAVKLDFNHHFAPYGAIGARGVSLYNYFRFLKVLDVNFEVCVRNVRNLILQNEDGAFGPDEPFLPFGAEPRVGENFYIGSREIFQQDLLKLNVHLTWGSLPEGPFWWHYLGYQPLEFREEAGNSMEALQYIQVALQSFQDILNGEIDGQDILDYIDGFQATLGETDGPAGIQELLTSLLEALEGITEAAGIVNVIQSIQNGLAGGGVAELNFVLNEIKKAFNAQTAPLDLLIILDGILADPSLTNLQDIATVIQNFQTILSGPTGTQDGLAALQSLQDSLSAQMDSLFEALLAAQPHPKDFKFDLQLLKNRAWQNFTGRSRYELFRYKYEDKEPELGRPLAEQLFQFELRPSPAPGADIPEEFDELDVNTTAGFIRLSLKPEDFKHEEFTDLLSKHLTAQGIWAVEIGQAEGVEAALDPDIPAEQAQLTDLLEQRPDFKPTVRVPDVVYLSIEHMLVLLKLAAWELGAWMAVLQRQFEKYKAQALADALLTVGKDHPDYTTIKGDIAGLEQAIADVAAEIGRFLATLNTANLKPYVDPLSGIYYPTRFPDELADAVAALQAALDAAIAKNTELIGALEEHGRGPLYYVNLGISAAAALMEGLENGAQLRLESIQDIASILTEFYAQNEDGETYDSTYNTHHIPVPREPYTPEVSSIKIDYRAQAENHQVTFFHLYPFEDTFQQYDIETGKVQPELLPKFTDEGALYIGLDNLHPGSILNLLFQMAESTADPFTEQAEVSWSYLADDQWEALEDKFDVLSDETNGLIKSGIVKLSIPLSITNDNKILPTGLYWIKAAVQERSKAISESVAIHTQAARAVFVDRGNDLDRLSGPLPKESITESVETFDEVEGINQFYDSFGGRPKEKNIAFYTRVSERLRHKGRGVTLFDFERLILEHFPQIYKVKCITHTLGRMAGAEEDKHLAPGFVAVAVIPNLRAIQSANRFQPRATVALLKDIEKLIRKRISPFVRLRVLNPDYEPVNFSGNIGFAEGVDQNFFKDKLREDVRQFLAPWAFDPTAQIVFGGRIFRSTVLRFVEERPYIDFVTEFAMFGADKKNVPDIAASAARSILVPGRMNFEAVECCFPANS